MSIELEKIDANCNNCIHMVRNMEKYSKSLELHKQWQLEEFTRNKALIITNADKWLYKETTDRQESIDNLNKANVLEREAEKMKFQFDKGEVIINYGFCDKLKKDVSFIPGICQLETQDCFKHRREV